MNTVTLNLDGTSRSVRGDLWRVWLQPDPPEPGVQVQIQAVANSSLNWNEFSKLKNLVELHYAGRDAGVLEYLVSRPSIKTFEWSEHGHARIDLSRLQIRQAWLDLPEGDFHLVQPASGSLKELTLRAPREGQKVKVTAPDDGRELSLRLLCRGLKEPPDGVDGLSEVRVLDLWSVTSLRLANFSCFPQLRELIVYGPPGRIQDLEFLSSFPELQKLRLRECYFLNASAMPSPSELPRLKSIEIDGIRESDAAQLEERLAGGPKLSIRGCRSDAWLRANIDNPFREWEDEYPQMVAKGATSAYRKAVTAIGKLPADVDTEAARRIMEEFVAAFNRLNRKHDLDTIMREEVQSAFDDLVQRMPASVDRDAVTALFHELRDF